MKRLLSALIAILIVFCTACQAAPVKQDVALDEQDLLPIEQDILPYRFADREEGIELFMGNSDYYNGFTKNDLEYRMQKKGAQLEEWLEFGCEQVMDFTDEERAAVNRSFGRILAKLDEKGYELPKLDELVLIKTTMKEEDDASAYTHKNHIYLGDALLKAGMYESGWFRDFFDATLCHEIFHCLTRSNPQFRKDMYNILGFTIADEEFEMVPEVLDRLISNPDVTRHDSYAEFTIDGKKMNCFTVLIITKPFEKEGDIFFKNSTTGLIPIDDPNVIYTMDDATDFWDVFGRNTEYVLDPEECLADNFGFTIMFGNTNAQGVPLKSPHITEAIDAYLKGRSQ